MRLGWSKNDKSEGQQRDRELARNAGQLLGRCARRLPLRVQNSSALSLGVKLLLALLDG